MIVDSSALIAIVRREPQWQQVLEALRREPASAGAPTIVETALVLTALIGSNASTKLARLLQELGVTVVAFGPAHWTVAVDAFDRFGKGRHPAKLNFGDCMTYAVARMAGQPLLALGADFPKTDLELAWP